MGQVVARFRVTGVELIPSQKYGANPPERYTATRVKLYGVQGGPFGEATPSANCEMTIHNPEAAKVFEDAVRDQAQGWNGEFEVTFRRL